MSFLEYFFNDPIVLNLTINVIVGLVCLLLGILGYRVFDERNRRNTRQVKLQAFTDQLTGRGNRYKFFSVIDTLIKKDKKFAVCFMDLDGFKQINDSMGHDAGDELLVALANTFDKELPSNASAYRLGGDEFAIIIEKVKTTGDITKVLDALREKLNKPFIIENTSISIEYSLGIAIYPDDADNRQDLVMFADDAMYYIKEHGKNDYYFHNKVLKAKLDNKNKMQKDLKIAYENNQFGIDLQPRIDTNDTSKIYFEALLYWNHPILGKITSSYFIHQADEMALTIKLDQYVLEMVCKKLTYFKEKGYKNIKIAVNISSRHASKKDFVDKLCNILNENSIDPGEIQIEITDTLELSKIESYKLMFEKLKACGADIIVNNMEIKYEAIKLFFDLPINEIKLSASYVYDENRLNPEILENIIRLCKNMNYKIVISSIESEKELNYCIKKRADRTQRNILFKRMSDELTEEFINEYSKYINKLDNIILSAKNMKKLL